MNRNADEANDVDALPRFKSRRTSPRRKSKDPKSQVEAIMARREAMVGSKE